MVKLHHPIYVSHDTYQIHSVYILPSEWATDWTSCLYQICQNSSCSFILAINRNRNRKVHFQNTGSRWSSSMDYAMKAYKNHGGKAPFIISNSTKFRWMVSFKLQPFYLCEKSLQFSLHRIWVRASGLFWMWWRENPALARIQIPVIQTAVVAYIHTGHISRMMAHDHI